MPNELIQINILIFAISTIPIRNKIDDKSTKIVQNPVKWEHMQNTSARIDVQAASE